MHYKFPEIRTLEDVLPHIKDREEFIVAEREFGTVVNYMVSMPNTFDMEGPDDVGGAIRRECRGIKFDPVGNIAARPFHKFFNINEREETQTRFIDLTRPHRLEVKADGSMIHPMLVDGNLRWMTKMGLSDVALQAEEFVVDNPKYIEFGLWCIGEQLTPLFEWCSRKQRIVIDYPEDTLRLLAVRHNVTGEYQHVEC